jgi:hypothetical protein
MGDLSVKVRKLTGTSVWLVVALGMTKIILGL